VFWHLCVGFKLKKDQLSRVSLQYPRFDAFKLYVCFWQTCYCFRIALFTLICSVVQVRYHKRHKQREGVEKRFAVCVFLPLAALWLKIVRTFPRL
jgi:hypothetical protein